MNPTYNQTHRPRMPKQRYFQYIMGDKAGEVVRLRHIEKDDDILYFYFSDGDSCNAEFISPMTNNPGALKGKLLVEVEGTSSACLWTIEEAHSTQYRDPKTGEVSVVPSIEELYGAKEGTKRYVKPKATPQYMPGLPTYEEYGIPEDPVPAVVLPEPKPANTPDPANTHSVDQNLAPSWANNVPPALAASPAAVQVVKPTEVQDPVILFVNKCKKYKTSIDITVDMMLPSKSLYDIINNEFENVTDKFIDYVVDSLDVSSIKDAIKVALRQSYCMEATEEIEETAEPEKTIQENPS